MTLELRTGYWTVVLATGQAIMTFASLEAAQDFAPEAVVVELVA